MLESMGLAACLVTWLVMSWLVPRSPSLGKYLATGLACLLAFGWFMSRLAPDADPYTHVLPLLVLNGCFIMLGLATAAIHTFKGLAGEDRLFAHGYQLKVIVAQLAMALGTSLATLVTQWRNTVQYERVGTFVDPGTGSYVAASARILSVMATRGGVQHGPALTISTIAQDLARQATMVGDSEYFFGICLLGILALFAMVAWRVIDHVRPVRA
jgi:cell division protein FtsW (lipid II flippase)